MTHGVQRHVAAIDLVREAVAESEVQMMRVLQAEVEGLTKGAVRPETPEDAARIEAETEAGFDNMPV